MVKEIMAAIKADSRLGFSEKASITSAVSNLRADQLQQIVSLLRSVGGFGAGVVIARFMLNMGWLGSIVGGALGMGATNAIFGQKTPRTNYGLSMTGGRGIFG